MMMISEIESCLIKLILAQLILLYFIIVGCFKINISRPYNYIPSKTKFSHSLHLIIYKSFKYEYF